MSHFEGNQIFISVHLYIDTGKDVYLQQQIQVENLLEFSVARSSSKFCCIFQANTTYHLL